MPLGAFKAALMGTAGVSTADVVLLSSQTASNSASITFTGLMTSTYGEYIFKFYNINPATDGVHFSFQVNATDGADYNDSAITSSFFRAVQEQDANPAELAYITNSDLAQSASFQMLTPSGTTGNGSDESLAGELHIFNPASTTYVKHFYARTSSYYSNHPTVEGIMDSFAGGYINDTTAIDDIQFKINSGNFDGTIKMWGVK